MLAIGDTAVDIYGYGRVLFQIITGDLSGQVDEKTRPVRCRRHQLKGLPAKLAPLYLPLHVCVSILRVCTKLD